MKLNAHIASKIKSTFYRELIYVLWWRISEDGVNFTSSAHYGRRSYALKAGREEFQGKAFYIKHEKVDGNAVIEKIPPLPPSCFKHKI